MQEFHLVHFVIVTILLIEAVEIIHIPIATLIDEIKDDLLVVKVMDVHLHLGCRVVHLEHFLQLGIEFRVYVVAVHPVVAIQEYTIGLHAQLTGFLYQCLVVLRTAFLVRMHLIDAVKALGNVLNGMTHRVLIHGGLVQRIGSQRVCALTFLGLVTTGCHHSNGHETTQEC